MTPADIIRKNSEPGPGGCILWTGSVGKHGYGNCSAGRNLPNKAHRLAYVLAHGPIPSGMFVCHRCDVPRCINPDHLFLGTPLDNTRDCVRKGRAVRAKGSAAGLSKLTEEQVRAILESAEPRVALATRFGVTPMNIRYIQTRRTWRHVVVESPGPNTGPVPPGASRPKKLSAAQVREILASDEAYVALAQRYGVVHSTIALIKTGHHWRDVSGLELKAPPLIPRKEAA